MKTYKYLNSNELPTPMIAIYYESNKDIWNEKYEFEFGKFEIDKNFKHAWIMNAYIIFDLNKKSIISYKFNELTSLVWLLRIMNIELSIKLHSSLSDEIQNNYKEEFELI